MNNPLAKGAVSYFLVSFECGRCGNFRCLGLSHWRDQILLECPLCGMRAALVGYQDCFWVVIGYDAYSLLRYKQSAA